MVKEIAFLYGKMKIFKETLKLTKIAIKNKNQYFLNKYKFE